MNVGQNLILSVSQNPFDKGKARDFKPYSRYVHVTSYGQYAWFSELLTIRMGICRGAGVLYKTTTG